MNHAEVRRAEKTYEKAQKKVRKARQALANAEERRNYAHVELQEQRRLRWLISQSGRR